MLAKPAMLLLGMISEGPKGAYEITKMLDCMNVKWWFNISDSTVYSTIKSLEKRKLVSGKAERKSNMPERTVYSISQLGKDELKSSIKEVFMTMDYDTTIYSIAVTYINIFSSFEQVQLFYSRLQMLQEYLPGIENSIKSKQRTGLSVRHIENIIRMKNIVLVEIDSVKKMLEILNSNNIEKRE
ncbi:PadR family transcriptional regulator [Tissierella sp. MSJ-40]|uniref:PadR family transcriptional regulator n=1 Tax=Tissierella simiarum TaxID=2841534 RepID=A0ABS6E9Q5_9FIRM|nr:PadR family transcriptional regulator [Tissierella simiarum]MBU5439586.1 PadR family transcriptional regulator [Tissierella simiarum]